MVYMNTPEYRLEKMTQTLELIDYSGHAYIAGEFVNKNSKLVVFCLTHNKENTTTFTNYFRSVTGMPCCGKTSKSKALTGRVYSAETIEKMRNAAYERIKPQSNGQDWRRCTTSRNWERKVQAQWGKKCAISGSNQNVIHNASFFFQELATTLMLRPVNSSSITYLMV